MSHRAPRQSAHDIDLATMPISSTPPFPEENTTLLEQVPTPTVPGFPFAAGSVAHSVNKKHVTNSTASTTSSLPPQDHAQLLSTNSDPDAVTRCNTKVGALSGTHCEPESGKVPKAASTEMDEDWGQRLRCTIEAPQGCTISVCPYMPFRVETRFYVTVGDVAPVPGMGNAVQVIGRWWRTPVGTPLRAAKAVPVELVLTDAGPPKSDVCATYAQGPGRFARCAAERWVLSTGGAVPHVGPQWRLLLTKGARIVLQRPQECTFILRNPKLQLHRLVMELASERGERLLAAPVCDSDYALVVLSLRPREGPLLPWAVRDELENRFSIVFEDSKMCADPVSVAVAHRNVLQRLVAHGVGHVLQESGWVSVEEPLKFCSRDILKTYWNNGVARHELMVKVPSVQVNCHTAGPSQSGGLEADLELLPSVNRVYPLANLFGRLRSGEMVDPEVAAHYALRGCVATQQLHVNVLPRLTEGVVTNVYLEGLPPSAELPDELGSVDGFAEYWRLVHGYRLPPDALRSFACVFCPKVDIKLMYPLACLWRRGWESEPCHSRLQAGAILMPVLVKLREFSLLGGRQSIDFCGGPLLSLQASHLPASRALAAFALAAAEGDDLTATPLERGPFVERLAGAVQKLRTLHGENELPPAAMDHLSVIVVARAIRQVLGTAAFLPCSESGTHGQHRLLLPLLRSLLQSSRLGQAEQVEPETGETRPTKRSRPCSASL